MAKEKKKYKGVPFKYLPVGHKVCRIIAAALYLTAVPPLIVGMVFSIEFSGTTACVGPLITACLFMIAGLIVFLVSESKVKKLLAEGKIVVPEPGQQPVKQEDKSQEVKQEQPKAEASGEEVWFCPECGHKNTGEFCVECGTKKPECVSSSKEETTVVEEKAEKPQEEKKEEQPSKGKNVVQKILNIAIPLGTVGIIAVWYLLAFLIDFIVEIIDFFQYGLDDVGGYFGYLAAMALWQGLGLLTVGVIAVIMVIIHLTSKFNAVKAFKFLPLLPAGLMLCFPLYWIGNLIYWNVINAGSDYIYTLSGKSIAVIVLSLLALGLCIAAFIMNLIFAKKGKRLVGNIATAVALVFSTIPMFISASYYFQWYCPPAYVALGIFLMLAAAGNFFIKPKE